MFIAIRFIEKDDTFFRRVKVEVSARDVTEYHVDAYRVILTKVGGERITFYQAAIS